MLAGALGVIPRKCHSGLSSTLKTDSYYSTETNAEYGTINNGYEAE
jgi:hypothetical protein